MVSPSPLVMLVNFSVNGSYSYLFLHLFTWEILIESESVRNVFCCHRLFFLLGCFYVLNLRSIYLYYFFLQESHLKSKVLGEKCPLSAAPEK